MKLILYPWGLNILWLGATLNHLLRHHLDEDPALRVAPRPCRVFLFGVRESYNLIEHLVVVSQHKALNRDKAGAATGVKTALLW